jgi:uncharacterized delta-60 repeat protein
VLADGRIAAAGRVPDASHHAKAAVVALRAEDGALDPNFGGGNNPVFLSPHEVDGFDRSGATAIKVDGAGRIVLAGVATCAANEAFAPGECVPMIARLSPSGALDTTFGDAGDGGARAGIALASRSRGRFDAVAVDPQGRILASGAAPAGAQLAGDILAARVDATGTPDATFGNGGVLVLNVSRTVPTHDQRVVALVAPTENDAYVPFAVLVYDEPPSGPRLEARLMRLGTNGLPDWAFGEMGAVATPLPNAVTLQAWSAGAARAADGSLLFLAPSPRSGDSGDMAVMRVLP